MTADGSIIIDTRLDTSGINAGAVNLEKSFTGLTGKIKKLGIAIGAAFAVKEIVKFGVAGSKAARELSDSMIGLQSILEGQGRSFSEAKSFIDEYISDGLVPATNATAAYKNLASRGYDDSQIQQVLVALKDASAYGRQASYSMGEAVQSATEGLKNENSILVDNAGVTKNVAKMWDEYAASIGTTANNLTKQQKIQAEVTGILNETRFQTGDAARVAGTLSGQLQQLSFNFNNLKIAVGNIVNPFIKVFLPVINAAINAVTRFANKVAEVVNMFFGTSMGGFEETATQMATGYDDSAAGAEKLASSTNNVADATKKASKEAKKYLSPLDQINKYAEKNTSSDTTPSTSTGGGGISGGSDIISGGFDAIEKGNGVIDQATSKFSEFAAKMKAYLAPLTEQLRRFGEIAKSAFTWFLNNVLKPLGNFTVNEVLPRFFQTLANVMKIFNNILLALQPLWQWFWRNVLEPIARFTAEVFLKAWDLINDALDKFANWCSENPKIIETAAIVIGSFFAAFMLVGLFERIITIVAAISSFVSVVKTLSTVMGAGSIMTGLFGKVIAALTSPAGIAVAAIGAIIAIGVLLWKNWDKVKEKTKQIWGNIKDWLKNTLETMKKNFASNINHIKNGFSNGWNAIKTGTTKVWNGIKSSLSSVWNGVKNTASSAFNGIKNTVSNAWENVKNMSSNVWNGIKNTVVNVLKAIGSTASSVGSTISTALSNGFEKAKNLIKKPINGVIGLLNAMVSGLIAGVNLAIGVLNRIKVDIPSWIPVYGGKTFGFNLPKLSAPKIPYLATGAVIPPNAPFMAVLGDQKQGTNIETPEKLLRSIIREELGGRNNTNNKYQFTANINRRTLFDEMITEAMMRQASSGRNPFELA